MKMENLTSKEILAINLKYYRYQHKLSQEKFVDLLKSSLSYINQLENGQRNPSLDMLDKIARKLNIETHLLLKYDKKHIVSLKRIDQKNNVIKNDK